MSPQESKSEAAAALLREHPPRLDELAKARLERRLLGAATRPTEASSWRGYALCGGVLLAAAALAFVLWPKDRAGPTAPADLVARFEVREIEASARRGTLEEGSVLPTGPDEVADIRIAGSGIHIGASSRVRMATLSATRLALELGHGEIRVAFHPRAPGREQLTVDTPEARVEVVGTEFTVRSAGGVTDVVVSEGVVRVVSLDRGDATLVRAGERSRVERDGEQAAIRPAPLEAASEAASEAAPEARAGTAAAAPGSAAPARLGPAETLARARQLVASGDEAAATPLLRTLTHGSVPAGVRAQGWTLLADLAQRDGRLEEASGAYERVAEIGRGTLTGSNAVYALARLQERRLADPGGARQSYRRYLDEAPSGPLAGQARQALCRLGEEGACGSR